MSEWSTIMPFTNHSSVVIPEKPGIYFFLGNKNVNDKYPAVYVGQASNLHDRFLQYVNGENKCVTQNARNYRFMLEGNAAKRNSLEIEYIQRYKPTCNVHHN